MKCRSGQETALEVLSWDAVTWHRFQAFYTEESFGKQDGMANVVASLLSVNEEIAALCSLMVFIKEPPGQSE